MVYVILAEGFEEIEAVTPIDILRRASVGVKTIGVSNKKIVGRSNIPIECDMILDDSISTENLEMIVLPGGMPGTTNLEKDTNVSNLIEFCVDNNVYIAAICAAPMILGKKGYLNGKSASCYPGFENYLIGANISNDDVCIDGKFITSKGAGSAMGFSLKLVELLKGKEKSCSVGDSICVTKNQD